METLVRHKIKNGASENFRTLEPFEMRAFLIKKFEEIAGEVIVEMNNQDRARLMEALADLMALVNAIQTEFKISPFELMDKHESKKEQEGEFSKGVVLCDAPEKFVHVPEKKVEFDCIWREVSKYNLQPVGLQAYKKLRPLLNKQVTVSVQVKE